VRKTRKELAFKMAVTLMVALAILSSACSRRDDTVSFNPTSDPPVDKSPTDYRYSSASQPNLNLKSLFDQKCAVCHGGDDNAAGGIMLDDYLRILSRDRQIWKAVQPGGSMADKAGPDGDKIMNWIMGGLPE
jgi:hypothetical protein